MPFVSRPGNVRIYYEVHGSGQTILLSHGFSATLQMWKHQISVLSKDHQLIVWDMRGHGKSSYPDEKSLYSEAHTIGDMWVLLNQVANTKRAIVGGLSLGGYMSLAFYRAHPGKVAQLLIFDTGPGFKKDEARESWNRQAHGTAADLEKSGLKVLQKVSAERSPVDHRNAKGLVLAAKGMLAQRDDRIIQTIPKIKVPTLVIVGADDKYFLAAADYMATKIPNAERVIIADAGHASNLDQPQSFNSAVMKFLLKHENTIAHL